VSESLTFRENQKLYKSCLAWPIRQYPQSLKKGFKKGFKKALKKKGIYFVDNIKNVLFKCIDSTGDLSL